MFLSPALPRLKGCQKRQTIDHSVLASCRGQSNSDCQPISKSAFPCPLCSGVHRSQLRLDAGCSDPRSSQFPARPIGLIPAPRVEQAVFFGPFVLMFRYRGVSASRGPELAAPTDAATRAQIHRSLGILCSVVHVAHVCLDAGCSDPASSPARPRQFMLSPAHTLKIAVPLVLFGPLFTVRGAWCG